MTAPRTSPRAISFSCGAIRRNESLKSMSDCTREKNSEQPKRIADWTTWALITTHEVRLNQTSKASKAFDSFKSAKSTTTKLSRKQRTQSQASLARQLQLIATSPGGRRGSASGGLDFVLALFWFEAGRMAANS